MTRYVIVHNEMGVYLGSFMGLGFWTILDPVGQPVACTFYTVEQAREFMKEWETAVDQNKIWFCPVECDDYADIPTLKKAGLSHMLGDMEKESLLYATPAGNA